MDAFPKVSLIIPTYNREKELVETIRSVMECEYPAEKLEVLLIDQTILHQPETLAFLSSQHISWYRPPEVSFTSLTMARNFGITKANSPEIILFVDDDVLVKKDFIQKHVEAFQDPQVGAIVGRVVVPGKPMLDSDGPVGKITWFGGFINNYTNQKPSESGNLIGCNFSLRASILEKAGQFDERFIGNALREDSDMAVRVLKSGFKISFVPGAGVIHKEAVSGGTRSQSDRIKWYFALFYNNFLFYSNAYPLWRLPFFILHMWRPILACWLWYGKGSLGAFLTPWKGIIAGVKVSRNSDELEQI